MRASFMEQGSLILKGGMCTRYNSITINREEEANFPLTLLKCAFEPKKV